MDTIRKKMYLLKLETSDTINRLLTVETAAARNSEALKDREQNLRKLMKEVSKRDNGETILYVIIKDSRNLSFRLRRMDILSADIFCLLSQYAL